MNQACRLFLTSLAGGFLFSLCVLSAARAGVNPKIIEAAKEEGKVSYYTTMTLSQSKKVVDKFQQKYPFIQAELFRGGGDEVLNRIQNEAKGGLYAWDVVSTRGDSVLALMDAQLITSYRSPEARLINKDMVDDEGYWTAYYVNPYVLGYNTKLVKNMRFPKPTNSCWILSGKEKGFPSMTQPMGFLPGSTALGVKKRQWPTSKSSPLRPPS